MRGRPAVWLTTGLLLTTGLAAVPPALAATPSNDDVENARVVSSVPYTNTIRAANIADATSQDTDSTCTAGDTVWYRFTPGRSRAFQVDTFGSDYDTTLAVFTGTPGDLTEIACVDDTVEFMQAGIRLNMTAGTTYFIEAGRCCGRSGRLVFNVSRSVPPLELSVEVTSVVTDRSGLVEVAGTFTCKGATEYAEVFGELRQVQGLDVAVVQFYDDVACVDETVAWTAEGAADRVLLAKDALLRTAAFGCDDFGCATSEQSQTIRLTRR